MKNFVRLVCGHPVRLALAAGLLGWMAAGTAVAQIQGGGPATAPSWGLGRGGPSLNPKNTPAPTVRSVEGVVRDSKGEVAAGAMVYLKNDRTAKVQSVTVDSTGKYRFAQVLRNDDYKLWAQAEGKKTSEKVISSFDPKVEVNRDLTIE